MGPAARGQRGVRRPELAGNCPDRAPHPRGVRGPVLCQPGQSAVGSAARGPFPSGFLDAGYSFVYVDEKWWRADRRNRAQRAERPVCGRNGRFRRPRRRPIPPAARPAGVPPMMSTKNNRGREAGLMIDVRQATPADQAAIYEFIQTAYAGRSEYKIPERWAWAYLNNPFKETAALPIWIAVGGDGRVVGQTCALIEPLKLG